MDFPNQVPPSITAPDPILTSPPPLTPARIPSAFSTPLATPVGAATAAPRRSLAWLWWSLGGVVAVGILGGGYFAYSRGYLAIPFVSPKQDQLFNKFVDSLTDINNAQYTVRVGLKSEARSAGTTSVFPSADEQKAQSNDTQRKSDLAKIRTALVLYYDDNHSTYPDTIDTTLAPAYLDTLPTDPKDKSKYSYQSCSAGKHFLLQTGLESNDYYYMTDTGASGEIDTVPTCGQNANASSKLLQLLMPTAYAQATSFSIESVGGEIGLGEPESNYPFLGLLNVFGLGDLQSVIDIFPTDIDTSAAITFYAQADKPLQDANALLAISGNYRGDDLSVEFDVEARKLGSTMYGIVRKFPGIPYLSKYVSPIKNTWIKVEPGDGNPILHADTFKQASIKSSVEKVRQSLKDALDGKIVTVDKSLGTESIAGVQSAHYRVALHPEAVKAVLQKIVADRKTKKLSTTTLDDAMKQLDKPGTLASLQRLADNSTVEVWVDKVKGYLRQMSWSIALIPPDNSDKFKGKQLRFTLTLTLDKVNQDVNVGRPGDSIDYSEAERKVTGISVEEQRFSRQRSQISTIREALTQIHDVNSSYPESITNLNADLKQALDACKTKQQQNSNTSAYVYCNSYLVDEGPIVLKDIYTDKPYSYTRVGNDYTLTYEMKTDFTNTNTDYSYGSYYKNDYVNGKNTATSKDVSTEKETTTEASDRKYHEALNANASKNTNAAAANTNAATNTSSSTSSYWSSLYPCLTAAPKTTSDYDQDGINDSDEYYKYGTNPCKTDTDGDTYTDKTEIDGGYNPLGAGKLSAPTVSSVKSAAYTVYNTAVSWSTSTKTTGRVEVGTTTAYGATTIDNQSIYTHTLYVNIQAYQPNQTIHYRVTACTLGIATLCTSSADQTFTIPASTTKSSVTPTSFSIEYVGKPAIYLYPTLTSSVSVQVRPENGFTQTIPTYGSGWRVVADQYGHITNIADGEKYPYLFWEGAGSIATSFDTGFVVNSSDVHSFLAEKLSTLGLSTKEAADFEEFWEPRLTGAPYFVVRFDGKAVMDKVAPLTVSPKPDTVIRVLMDYRPLSAPVTIQPQQLATPIRHGFTVVEWGGVLHSTI